jgi:hypothetical protein
MNYYSRFWLPSNEFLLVLYRYIGGHQIATQLKTDSDCILINSYDYG